jgi:hypothetical protein
LIELFASWRGRADFSAGENTFLIVTPFGSILASLCLIELFASWRGRADFSTGENTFLIVTPFGSILASLCLIELIASWRGRADFSTGGNTFLIVTVCRQPTCLPADIFKVKQFTRYALILVVALVKV